MKPALWAFGHLFVSDRHWSAVKLARKWFQEWRGVEPSLFERFVDEEADYNFGTYESRVAEPRLVFCYFDDATQGVWSYDADRKLSLPFHTLKHGVNRE